MIDETTPRYNRSMMIDGIPVTGPNLFFPKGHIFGPKGLEFQTFTELDGNCSQRKEVNFSPVRTNR